MTAIIPRLGARFGESAKRKRSLRRRASPLAKPYCKGITAAWGRTGVLHPDRGDDQGIQEAVSRLTLPR